MQQLICLGILLVWAAGCNAEPPRDLADIAVVDRASGRVLTPHYYRGEYWVAAQVGARYAIEIRNRLPERLLAVTSVDGVNVLSGATAAWDQEGYVFSPGEEYQITGWRKSDVQVAAFTFADARDSYAGRTGRPDNVGIIGVALFRERQTPVYAAPAPSRSAPRSESREQAADSAASAALPPAKLGTGHGAREYSYVEHTQFAREQSQPNQVIRIHYDSFDNLVSMGIVKRQTLPSPSPSPFPNSPENQYVPDPPG